MNAVAPLATDDEATASGNLLAQIRAARVYEVAEEVREGRVEVVPMWGRGETVSREVAQRRARGPIPP